jgi:hypothetical protein
MATMGRPRFAPTEEQRALVTAMVGYGIPEDKISELILNPQTGKPLSPKTLRRHFRKEIRTGMTRANSDVAASLFRHATGEGRGAVTAAIFWLKTRAGWKETQRHELTDGDGKALGTGVAAVTDERFEEIAKRLLKEV